MRPFWLLHRRYDLVMTAPNNPAKARLEELIRELNASPETGYSKLRQQADIRIAIETCDALFGLTVAVNEMAHQSIQALNTLTGAITAATEQAGTSSAGATAVATQSANLSAQLNRLTKWIIWTAVLSAIAAVIQAGVALFGVLRN